MSKKEKQGMNIEKKLNISDHKGGDVSLTDDKMSLSFAGASLCRREAGES